MTTHTHTPLHKTHIFFPSSSSFTFVPPHFLSSLLFSFPSLPAFPSLTSYFLFPIPPLISSFLLSFLIFSYLFLPFLLSYPLQFFLLSFPYTSTFLLTTSFSFLPLSLSLTTSIPLHFPFSSEVSGQQHILICGLTQFKFNLFLLLA